MIKSILKFSIFLLSIISSQSTIAQPLSVRLKMSSSESNYPLFIECPPNRFFEFIESRKYIKVGSQVGDIFTVYTNKYGLEELYHQSWISNIQDGKIEVFPLMDSARIHNHIDSVHNGIQPLLTNYKGRNVVLGIIDFGIEWRHLDFKNNATDTRILSIWDQNKDSVAPQGFSYGHEWKKSVIDAGLCTHNASSSYGHGTNVAGIAVGNGNVIPQNKGVATEAKIIVVSLKNNQSWLANVIDGIQFIFDKADSLGLPAVVNLSLGTYDGSHDGRDLSTRMMESILNKKRRVIIAAAGNAGHMPQHIRFSPNMDTTFTDFVYTPAFSGSYFNFWADTSDVKNLTIGIQADSPTTLLPISKPYFFNFTSRFLDSLRKYGYYEDSLDVLNSLDSSQGMAYFYVLKQENTVNFQSYIVPKKTTTLWRFSTTGQGKIDMWVNNSLQTTSNIYNGVLPSVNINPNISKYQISDLAMSITSGFQCSDKIITVGNYVNKYGITDIDNIYRPIGGKPMEIASNSSKGPTRDGRWKPDLSATGGQILTTIDSITSANFAVNAGNRKKLGITGKYSVAGGTSMASPIVAGTVALLLEKYPQLDYSQVLYLLQKTVKRDSFTGNQVNNTYGYGKLNAFELLKYNVIYGCRDTGSINYNPFSDFEDSTLCIKKVYGCTDTASINYNPLANVDNGSCIKKVYGCTDTGSINYNPLANVDNGSCIKKIYGCMDSFAWNYNPLANVDDGSCYYSAIKNEVVSGIKIYPIPAKEFIRIELLKDIELADIQIYSTMGIKVYNQSIPNSTIISLSSLARGHYIMVINYRNENEKIKLLLE